MAIGSGVSPASLEKDPVPEEPKDKNNPETTVDEVESNPVPEPVIIPSNKYVWQEKATHTNNFTNPRYWRYRRKNVRVFDMAEKQDREAYEDLLQREAGSEIERDLDKYNVRFLDRGNPLAFPPDPGKTNLRIYREWGDLEFVRLDKDTGLPQAGGHE